MLIELLALAAAGDPPGYFTSPMGVFLNLKGILKRLYPGRKWSKMRPTRDLFGSLQGRGWVLAGSLQGPPGVPPGSLQGPPEGPSGDPEEGPNRYCIPWLIKRIEVRVKRAEGGNKSLQNPNVPRPRKDILPESPKDILPSEAKDIPHPSPSRTVPSHPSPSPGPCPPSGEREDLKEDDDQERAWALAEKLLPTFQPGVNNARSYIRKTREDCEDPYLAFPWLRKAESTPPSIEKLCSGCNRPLEKLSRRTGASTCLSCESKAESAIRA
jgi:hypothetical protein